MLETNDLTGTVDFYTHTLGFHCIEKYPNDTHPLWVNMKRDEAEIMFASHARVKHESIGTQRTNMTGSIYFYPTDVDAVWNELKDAAMVESPISNYDYGMREFAVRDCNGYLLHFGHPIESD
jgi:uncharacterized glyoxalase superfamily protein PhnB